MQVLIPFIDADALREATASLELASLTTVTFPSYTINAILIG